MDNYCALIGQNMSYEQGQKGGEWKTKAKLRPRGEGEAPGGWKRIKPVTFTNKTGRIRRKANCNNKEAGGGLGHLGGNDAIKRRKTNEQMNGRGRKTAEKGRRGGAKTIVLVNCEKGRRRSRWFSRKFGKSRILLVGEGGGVQRWENFCHRHLLHLLAFLEKFYPL